MATSGYSSFTDSQFFIGSQFWPENSQSASQDMSLSSRTSQQSSQEGSDPKLTNNYHMKPLLFGDKSKSFGILDKFEEEKKRVKEKADSDVLAKELQQFGEILNNIQQMVCGTERNTAGCQTILGKFDSFASMLQNNLSSVQSDITKQFETLLEKVNSQKEKMAELEERMQKSGDGTAGLGSDIQSLRKSLECLREEQEKERGILEETLKLLNIFVSEHSAKPQPDSKTDCSIQTSPVPEEQFSNILQDNKLEETQRKCKSNSLGKHSQAIVPSQNQSYILGKRKLTQRGNRRHKKRPLVLSQRRRNPVQKENSQPPINVDEQQKVSSPLHQHCNQNRVNPECQIVRHKVTSLMTPINCWSQDSNSSVCTAGIEPILEKLSDESMTPAPQGFWQLFDMNSDIDL